MITDQTLQSPHLERSAYIYVRQATSRQFFENTDSIQRQYALKESAIALGWPADDIVVIDSDIAESGDSIRRRKGIQKLIKDVSLGRVGIIMASDIPRFTRNYADWSRLLLLCAENDTLIFVHDRIYDPAECNDRLLLGFELTLRQGCSLRRRVRRRTRALNTK